jgi:hypothetical protein
MTLLDVSTPQQQVICSNQADRAITLGSCKCTGVSPIQVKLKAFRVQQSQDPMKLLASILVLCPAAGLAAQPSAPDRDARLPPGRRIADLLPA